ncbi:MAG TPA: hypothetical protein VHN14_12025 [Kofleriaceae bacterium]|nr:hypothetical protein [Kofleriaceae bacterium]
MFATSLVPDNPAFEKSKHQTLMDWRAARRAAAKLFKAQKVKLPLYPAYEVATTEVELVGSGSLDGMIEAATDCASCRVRSGAIVSASRRPGSPHATVEDPSFGMPAFRADCHQFTFPVLAAGGEVTRMTSHPMQTTVASFRTGPYAAQPGSCMTCHGSRENHAFLGGHESGMREAALDVTWCRPGDAMEVRVRNAAAGPTVPTGDIHRHMTLRAWRPSTPEALFEAFYGRRFDPADDSGKVTVWDSTIAPEAIRQHTISLASLGDDDGEPLNLELTYAFLENEFLRPSQAPAEPFTASIVRRRAAPDELAPCSVTP